MDTDNSSNEVSWTIQSATAATGPWSTIAMVSSTGPGKGSTVNYTTPALARRTTYFFRVMATNIVGDTTIYPAPAVGYPNMAANSAPVISNSITTV